MTGKRPRASSRRGLLSRAESSIAGLNDGTAESVLAHSAEDVLVTTPLYRPGDSGEAVVSGKPAFRDYLERFTERYRPLRVLGVSAQPDGFVASIELGGGVGEIAYSAVIGRHGLVTRVGVFAVR